MNGFLISIKLWNVIRISQQAEEVASHHSHAPIEPTMGNQFHSAVGRKEIHPRSLLPLIHQTNTHTLTLATTHSSTRRAVMR